MFNSALVRIALLALGCGLVYGAVVQQQKRAFFKKYGLAAAGIVTRLERDSDPESAILYPIITFTTLTRESVTVRLEAGTSPSVFYVGQHMAVLYNPLAPKEFVLASGAVDWLAYSLGLAGVALLSFTLYKCFA